MKESLLTEGEPMAHHFEAIMAQILVHVAIVDCLMQVATATTMMEQPHGTA